MEGANAEGANEVSPTAISGLIDRLAEEKASRLRTLAKATVVMCVTPEWMRAEEVNAYFGVPMNQLKDMVIRREVVAKKLDPHLTASAVIYRTADVRRAIDRLFDYADWIDERPDVGGQAKQKEGERE